MFKIIKLPGISGSFFGLKVKKMGGIMAWFEKEFIAFFKELEANNHKEWFDKNRKRYQQFVKDPFHDFVAEMISRIQKVDAEVAIQPKEAIFRINRDIRFSKDKTPYKTAVSAVISPGGRKNLHTPGGYFELSTRGIQYYGGAHSLEKDQLHKVRTLIAKDAGGFRKLITDKKFVATFGQLLGDKNKRIPKEFEIAAQREPLLFNKSFYFGKKLDAELIMSDKLADELFKLFITGMPFNMFLRMVMV